MSEAGEHARAVLPSTQPTPRAARPIADAKLRAAARRRWEELDWTSPIPEASLVIPEAHYMDLTALGLTSDQRLKLNRLFACFTCELFIHFEEYVIRHLERPHHEAQPLHRAVTLPNQPGVGTTLPRNCLRLPQPRHDSSSRADRCRGAGSNRCCSRVRMVCTTLMVKGGCMSRSIALIGSGLARGCLRRAVLSVWAVAVSDRTEASLTVGIFVHHLEF